MESVFNITKNDSKILEIETKRKPTLRAKNKMNENNFKNSNLLEKNYIMDYKNKSFSGRYNIYFLNNIIEISKDKKILETRKFKKIFYLLELLIIINLFYPIVSDISINLILKGPCSNEPIFNWKSYTKPSKIFLEGELSNIPIYNYDEGDYLKFNCGTTQCKIKLLWDQNVLSVQNNQVTISDIIHDAMSTIYIDELPSKAEKMFKNCNKILKIDLSGFKSDEILTMGNMFDSCTSLTTIDGLSVKNVKDLSYLFYDCISLTTINFRDIDTNPSKFNIDTNYMFHNCKQLETIDLRILKNKNIIKMEKMFYNCDKLKSLDLSSVDTSQIENMKNLFANCKALTSLKIDTNFNTKNVKNFGYMFYNCENLEFIGNAPDSFIFIISKAENMESMFKNCFNLVSLHFSFSFSNTG